LIPRSLFFVFNYHGAQVDSVYFGQLIENTRCKTLNSPHPLPCALMISELHITYGGHAPVK
jgi:hypothetical protein